jgi:alpha-tubulin suppressor-like RCC1 family protein
VFVDLDVGTGFTCGLKGDGDVYCWGQNVSGQLGDGSTTTRAAPVLVAGGHDFATLSLGTSNACARDTGGAYWCWGSNNSGQLTGGSVTANLLVPTEMTFAASYSGITVGGSVTCGVTGGSAYCWGSSELLGIDASYHAYEPVQVLPF